MFSFKVNSTNTSMICEICSKLSLKTSKQHHGIFAEIFRYILNNQIYIQIHFSAIFLPSSLVFSCFEIEKNHKTHLMNLRRIDLQITQTAITGSKLTIKH